MAENINYNQQYYGNEAALANGISGNPAQQIFGGGRVNPGMGDFNIGSLIGATDPAIQMLLNQFLMPILTKQMGPNAVAANYGQGNMYTEGLLKNSMADRGGVVEWGKKQDTVPMQNAMQGIAKMMGVNMGAREKEAMHSMAPMIASIMPGLESFIPGGLDSLYGSKGSAYKMAEGMYAGSRYRTDPATGARKMSGESILDVTQRVHQNLYGDNANISEMNGVTAGQAGSLFDEMQKRGMSGGGTRSRGDGLRKVADEMGKTISDISDMPELDQKLREIDANGISQKLKSMSKAVSAMKEIFGEAGQPNAPMSQVMGAIESLTQTNMQSMKPAEIETLIRSTHNASKIAGISMPQAYAQMGSIAGMLDRAGGDRIFAADTYIKSANETAAGKRIFGESAAFGRLTPEKMLNLNEQINVQATVDPIANEYAKIINAVDKHGAQFSKDSDIAAVYKALKDPNNEGKFTDAKGNKKNISSILNANGGINGLLKAEGVADTSIAYLSNESLNKQTMYENKGVQPASRIALADREDLILRDRFQGISQQYSSDTSFKPSDSIKNFIQDDQNRTNIAADVSGALLSVDAKGLENPHAVALNAIVSNIEKSQNRKLTEGEKKSLAPMAASMLAAATTRANDATNGKGLAPYLEGMSRPLQEEAAVVKKEMDQTTRFQSILSPLGKSNVTQRISDFIQKGDEYTTVGDGLQALLGYVPSEAVAKLLKPEIEDIKSKHKEYIDFNADRAKEQYLTSAIAVNNAALIAKPNDPALLKEKEELKKELKDNDKLGGKDEEGAYLANVESAKDKVYKMSNAQTSTLKVLESVGNERNEEQNTQYRQLVNLKKVYDSNDPHEKKAAAFLENMKSTFGLTSAEFKGKTAKEIDPDVRVKMTNDLAKSVGNLDTTMTSIGTLSGGFTGRKDLSAIESNLSSLLDPSKPAEGLQGLNAFTASYLKDSKMLDTGGKEGMDKINAIKDKVEEVKKIQREYGITEREAMTGSFSEARVMSKEKVAELKKDAESLPKDKERQTAYEQAQKDYDKSITPNEQHKKIIELKSNELILADNYYKQTNISKKTFKETALANIEARVTEVNSSEHTDADKAMMLESLDNQKGILNSKDTGESLAKAKREHIALTTPQEIQKQNVLYKKQSELKADKESAALTSNILDKEDAKGRDAVRDVARQQLHNKESVLARFDDNNKDKERLAQLKNHDKLSAEIAAYSASDKAITPEERKGIEGSTEATEAYDKNEEKKKTLATIQKDYKNEAIKLESDSDRKIADKVKGIKSYASMTSKDKEEILKLTGMTDAEVLESAPGKNLNKDQIKESKLKLIYEKQKAIDAGIKYGESFIVDDNGVAKKATDEEVVSGNFSYIDRSSSKVKQVKNYSIGGTREEGEKKFSERKNTLGGKSEAEALTESTGKYREDSKAAGLEEFSGTAEEVKKITDDIAKKRYIITDTNLSETNRAKITQEVAEKEKDVTNLSSSEYMQKATSKWDKVAAAKEDIDKKEAAIEVLKKGKGIKVSNEMLVEPTETEKTAVRELRLRGKSEDEINKIVKGSKAEKSKFIGLDDKDTKDATRILKIKDAKLGNDDKTKLDALIKKSGVANEDELASIIKNQKSVDPYANMSPADKSAIITSAKSLKESKDNLEEAKTDFKKESQAVQLVASKGESVKGQSLATGMAKDVADLDKILAIGGTSKLSDFEKDNAQRSATLLDKNANTTAVKKFLEDVNAPTFSPQYGEGSGRKEAAVLNTAMSRAAALEVSKEDTSEKKAKKEKDLMGSAKQMASLRDLFKKSSTTDAERGLIEELKGAGITKNTFGDEEKVKELEKAASASGATDEDKKKAKKAREEYNIGAISMESMNAITAASSRDGSKLSVAASPKPGEAEIKEVRLAKGANIAVSGTLVLKGKSAELTSFGTTSDLSKTATA